MLACRQDTDAGAIPVILKDNISWHFPFLSANTTPWQLEGVIAALKDAGFRKIVCVQNETVVTDAFKGERLNKYVPIFKKYGVEVLYNFRPADMNWIHYSPRSPLRVLDAIFPEGIRIPDYFIGKSILHLPTVKCHIYTGTTGAMKNAFGGLLNSRRHYTHSVIHETLNDLLEIQKEIHSGLFTVMDGTVCGNGPGPFCVTTMFTGPSKQNPGWTNSRGTASGERSGKSVSPFCHAGRLRGNVSLVMVETVKKRIEGHAHRFRCETFRSKRYPRIGLASSYFVGQVPAHLPE